jgi:hypothetical protein
MPRLTVVTSNHNIGYRDAVLQSPQWIADAVEQAGFDGIEWNDTPNVHPSSLAAGGLSRWLARQGHIQSMQQSWQSDRYADIPDQFGRVREQSGLWAASKGAAEQAFLITLLPHISKSLGKLQRVQRAAGRTFPVIVHPNEQHLGGRPRGQHIDYKAIRESGAFGPLRFQVTAEYLAALGVPLDSPDETIEALYATVDEREEFDEIVYDTHHAAAIRGGYALPQPAAIAGRLARDGRLAELQVCWRPDFGGDSDEIKKALDGRIADTPQGQALVAVNQNLPDNLPLYVALEVPASALGDDYWPVLRVLANRVRQTLPRLHS